MSSATNSGTSSRTIIAPPACASKPFSSAISSPGTRPNYQPPSLPGQSIILHGHCHQKSLMKMNSEVELLRRTGAEVQLLDSGCCGMAGPFGFEREKFEVSQTLAERVLLPAIRQADPRTILVMDGFSCREQIVQNSSRQALHLAQVLASQTPR